MKRLLMPCASLAALAATLSCGPIMTNEQDSPPAPSAPAHVTLSFDRVGSRGDGLDRLNLDVSQVLVFLGDTPARPDEGAPCRAGGAIPREASFTFDLDLHGQGRTELGRIDLDAGTIGELRLLVRAAEVDDHGRRRRGHGRLTCRAEDGTSLVVIRLLPAEHIELEHDRDEALVARFDANAGVGEEACDGSHGGDDCDAEGEHDLRAGVVLDHEGGDDGGGGDSGRRGGDDDHGGPGGGGGDDHGGGRGGGDDHRDGGHGGGGGGDDQGGGDDGGGDHGGGGGGGGGAGGGAGGGGGRQGSRVVIADQVPLTRAP
jgi:hypothetical protein